jgi:hypothetical protein
LEKIIADFLEHKDCSGLFYYVKLGDRKFINEDGWVCTSHDTDIEIGYNPLFDRYATWEKVSGILCDFHDSGLMHVSNGSEGEGIIYSVVQNCKKADNYTVQFVLEKILDCTRSDYWSKQGALYAELAGILDFRVAKEIAKEVV